MPRTSTELEETPATGATELEDSPTGRRASELEDEPAVGLEAIGIRASGEECHCNHRDENLFHNYLVLSVYKIASENVERMTSERIFKIICINRILHIFEAFLHKKHDFFKNWSCKIPVSILRSPI